MLPKFLSKGASKAFHFEFFFRRGRFEKFWGRLTVRGGGSGQSVSLVSGGGGGGPKLAKKASADI